MKLSEVILSYPFVHYDVDVTHFTARYSTAIEWLILETIQKIQIFQEYQSMTIEDFFSSLFSIIDTDRMILPCLINLRDIGALQLDEIYDQTDMKQTQMRQLHLTPIGISMQKERKLPGAESTDIIKYYYNITENQIFRDSKKISYQEKFSGIPVREMESPEDIAFPVSFVRDSIESLKTQQTHRPSWLMEETVIRELMPHSSELLWKNTLKALNVGKEMKCSVEGNENIDIDMAALSSLDLREPNSSLQVISVHDPDEEFETVVPSDKLSMLIGQMNSSNLCIANLQYCRIDGTNIVSSKRNDVNIRFFCSAEETNIKITRNMITIFTSENILPDGLVYLDSSRAVGYGAFSLSAGNLNRMAELAFIPKKKIDPKSIVLQCVEKFCGEYPDMLHIFRILGMPEKEIQYAEQIVGQLPSAEEKLRCLLKLNEDSVTLFRTKCFSDSKINELILDADKIAADVTDVQSAQRILEKYSSVDIFKKHSSIIETLIRILLKNIKISENLSDVHALLNQIQNIGKQYIKFVKLEGLYKNLYSDKVLNELVSKFADGNIYELETYTPSEHIIQDMRNLAERTQEILGLSMFDENSEVNMKKAVFLHRQDLEQLVNFLEQWRDLVNMFDSHIGDFEETSIFCPVLVLTNKNYQILSSALSLFCCNSAMKYRKIYILDTNALMKMPELLPMFDGKDTMVIIPRTVLSELDGLKEDENEEIAYQARTAIRQINNYSALEWINMKEESNLALISDDLESDKPDYRILSIALKYIIYNPVLVTDDINMRNIAKSYEITSMTAEGCAANIQQAEREMQQEKNSGKKNKKKRKK